MALYAIGDLQGCLDPLKALLDKIQYDPAEDSLWFTGDLVNRGPKSAEVIRFIKGLPNCVTVLGNHDLHLLAVAYVGAPLEELDTLGPLLEAPDRDELLDWLRQQPLLHYRADLDVALVHAGLPPQWSMPQAMACAAEVESVLRSDSIADFLNHMYGNQPDRWADDLRGWDRLRFITNCFTRLRYVEPDGRLRLKHKGPIGTQPAPCVPWFRAPNRKTIDTHILFGHWSTLGLHLEYGIVSLDTGCLWGHALTAVQIDASGRPATVYHIDCKEYRHPHATW